MFTLIWIKVHIRFRTILKMKSETSVKRDKLNCIVSIEQFLGNGLDKLYERLCDSSA